MIDKHMYPKNFFFAVTKYGIDGRRSLLIDGGHRRRRSSASVQSKSPNPAVCVPGESRAEQKIESPSQGGESQPKQNQQDATGADMTELADAMSALHFVPSSIRFGRGRAGFARR